MHPRQVPGAMRAGGPSLPGGAAALIGGAAWAIKGGAILAGFPQPPLAFEAGAPLFLVAAFGLRARIRRGTLGARVGTALLALAATLFAAALLAALARPAWIPRGEEMTPVGGMVLAGALALLAGLGTVGRRVQAERALAGTARHLPLALACGLPLLLVASGALAEATDERALEIPILAGGLAWCWIGVVMLRATPSRARTT